jgi:hypothetical protein
VAHVAGHSEAGDFSFRRAASRLCPRGRPAVEGPDCLGPVLGGTVEVFRTIIAQHDLGLSRPDYPGHRVFLTETAPRRERHSVTRTWPVQPKNGTEPARTCRFTSLANAVFVAAVESDCGVGDKGFYARAHTVNDQSEPGTARRRPDGTARAGASNEGKVKRLYAPKGGG